LKKFETLMLSKDEVLKFVRGLEPHSHVIAFYENPEDKRDLLYTYLISGYRERLRRRLCGRGRKHPTKLGSI